MAERHGRERRKEEQRPGGSESLEPGGTPGTDRISTLADSVFAIVMTLLVLGLNPPRVANELLENELMDEVIRLWPRIAAYVVSFLILGIYWIGHHTQVHLMRGVNRIVLWINIVFFMVVSLVPFTTHLIGFYLHEPVAVRLYAANLILISLLLLFHLRYAAASGLLRREANDQLVREATRHILFGPLAYAAAIAISFVDPRYSLLVILVLPALDLAPGPFRLHWTSGSF